MTLRENALPRCVVDLQRPCAMLLFVGTALAALACSQPPSDPYQVSDVTLQRKARYEYVVTFNATWSGIGKPIEALCTVRLFGEPEVRVGYAEVETAEEARQELQVPVRTSAPATRAVAACGPAL